MTRSREVGDLKEITGAQIIETVKELCLKANFELRSDVLEALKRAEQEEVSGLGKKVLSQILENAAIAKREKLSICQDTGYATVLLKIGQDVWIKTPSLKEAVNEGVRQAYQEGFLRKSIVKDPLLNRQNTGDNTPVSLFTEIVPGEDVTITVMPKGGGSENASALKILFPTDGVEGVKRFVLETVQARGADSCPPLVVGLGIGGSFDSVAWLAKKALLEPLNKNNADEAYAALERELLQEINQLGIGPGGSGGRITALAVKIKTASTHIGCLPVAVNLSCHALRSATRTL